MDNDFTGVEKIEGIPTGDLRQNIFQDNLGEPDPPREYKNLQDLIDFQQFSYNPRTYRTQEIEILQPQLEALGYSDIQWLFGETDSFGPLTRVCKAVGPNWETVWFVYG